MYTPNSHIPYHSFTGIRQVRITVRVYFCGSVARLDEDIADAMGPSVQGAGFVFKQQAQVPGCAPFVSEIF